MKIRITEPGWATFSELLGGIAFRDGVSVDDVSHADAKYLAGLIAIETVEEEGKPSRNPSATQELVDAHSAPRRPAPAPAPAAPAPAAPARIWTEAELSAIADEKGINGLRKIGEDLGLKDNAIAGLISKILAKNPAPAPAAPAAGEAAA